MPTTVSIPHVGEVDFPDSMSMDEITQASRRLHNQYSGLAAPRVQAPSTPGLTDQKAAFEGGGPIVPKDNEDFSATMQRAARAGKTVTEDQVTGQAIQGLRDAPKALAGAAVAGVAGPALLAAPGEAVAGGKAALAGLLPPAIKGVQAVGVWAKANPWQAMALYEVLKEIVGSKTLKTIQKVPTE